MTLFGEVAMKITGNLSVAFFLKLGIDLILLINILTLLILPFMLDFLYENASAMPAENGYSQSAAQEVTESGNADRVFPENTRWIILSEIPKESYGFMLGFLYFSGIATAMILFLLRRVLRNLQKDVILDHSNARIFKLLSLSCFILVISFIIKMIFYNTFLTIFCFFIFIILGLFCLVLSEVFRQGAVIKEENALTI
jgi:hypothetical protein